MFWFQCFDHLIKRVVFVYTLTPKPFSICGGIGVFLVQSCSISFLSERCIDFLKVYAKTLWRPFQLRLYISRLSLILVAST